MNWRFCPHCETQLDEATGICPACRWDPLDEPPPVAAVPQQSLMERYRGTEYDSARAAASTIAERRRSGPVTKARVLLLAGVVVLFGLYGGMLAWTQIKDTMQQMPVPASMVEPR